MVIAANIDETPQPKELPRDYCIRVASAKGKAVASSYPNDIVISADSTVAVGRRILGKPEDTEQAKAFYRLMSGRRHKIITAVCIINCGKIITKVVTTIVQFHMLGRSDIDLLINSNEWQDKCGGYSIGGAGAAVIKQIIGSHANVMGLPVDMVYRVLKGMLPKPS